jgi:hypothetical protein
VTQAPSVAIKDIPITRSFAFGEEAQVHWYEAPANFSGGTKTVCFFCMRSLASGAAFHCAYLHATQQALLEAHESAFAWFGGVFARIRYGDRKASIKKVCGLRRKETGLFIAFRSHWGFGAHFCEPLESYDKAALQGESGYFGRNGLVAAPRIRHLADLNQQLLMACQEDAQRRIAEGTETSHSLMLRERQHLHALPRQPFDMAQISFPRVDRSGFVRVKTNRYSTPLEPGMQAEARAHACYVEIWHNDQLVARHERCYGNQQRIANLADHSEPTGSESDALTRSAARAA